MTAFTTVRASPRPLVLLDETTTTALPDRIAALEERGAVLVFVDYSRLRSALPRLERLLLEHDLDFVLFARNDQVYDRRAIGLLIRALKVGYSSFSGIDDEEALTQTRTCLDDYLAGGVRLDLRSVPRPTPPSVRGERTFSLLFDLEQLGCARFGLPRILDVLDEFGAPATFFTTSFVREVYTDVFDVLAQRSHEIGLHGLYHEYLAGRDFQDQLAMIAGMKHAVGRPAAGANFIGRLDATTVEAMAASDLNYFVDFMRHRYAPFGYRRMPVRPMQVATTQRSIWMVPVNVETNNRPWPFVKRLVDVAIDAGADQDWRHVNVLLHPFRDGALRHIGDLQRLLDYLRSTLDHTPARLGDVVAELPADSPATFVHYELTSDGAPEARTNHRHLHSWWRNHSRYEERVGAVYRALNDQGHRPALAVGSTGAAASARTFAVYPHLPRTNGELEPVEVDPLEARVGSAVVVAAADTTASTHAFTPKSLTSDVVTALRASRPRRRHDFRGLLPEAGLRVAYRLTRGRHVF